MFVDTKGWATRPNINININHVYVGIDPRTYQPLLFFGVADADQASTILEKRRRRQKQRRFFSPR